MKDTLPKGWVKTRLESLQGNVPYPIGDGDHGQIKPTAYSEYGIPYIRVADIGWGKFLPKSMVYIPEEIHTQNLKSELLPGDVLIAKTGATIGKCCIIPKFVEKANTTSSVGKVTVNMDLLLPNWLLYYFLSSDFIEIMWSSSNRTAQPGFNIRDLKKFLIPLPPLNEQKRIVAKLDAIISRIDSVKTKLEKIPAIIKRFRQSVLTAAVTGKLTEKWREEHPEIEHAEILLENIRKERLNLYKQKKTSKPEDSPKINQNEIHFEINDNWAWCRISQVALKMSTGPFGSMLHKSDYTSNGIPVINPTNIIDKKMTPSDKMMVSKGTQQRLSKYLLFQNDIVIARRGDLSKCGIVTNNEEGWLCGTGSFFLKLGIDPTFFRFFYISDYCQSVLNSDAIGSTMANLNQKLLSKIIFPLPPLEEQKEIVRQVDRLLALADKLEAHYHKAKALIDKLSQSVLAKAFRGELVPQDPNDEPAEKLLERIMAEKAKMMGGGRQKVGGRLRRAKV